MTSLMSPFSLGTMNPTISSIALSRPNLCIKIFSRGFFGPFSSCTLSGFSTSSSLDLSKLDAAMSSRPSSEDEFNGLAWFPTAFFETFPAELLPTSARHAIDLLAIAVLLSTRICCPKKSPSHPHPLTVLAAASTHIEAISKSFINTMAQQIDVQP